MPSALKKERDIRKSTGSHFTPSGLARFVANQIFENYDFDAEDEIRVLEMANMSL